MPYNEELDARIKKVVFGWKNTTNRKMFGGVCHLINGNMRLGEKTSQAALSSEHVRPFEINFKPMK